MLFTFSGRSLPQFIGASLVTTVRHDDKGSGIANGCFKVTYAPTMDTGTVPGVRVALELRILKS